MKLFIDTNILLSFYHLTSEDIEELKKLVALIDKKEIELLLPEQIVDEFYRNREGKIRDALKKLREARLRLEFPAFCKDYSEYEELQQTIRTADEMHAALVSKVTSDASSSNLAADSIVDSLFRKATRIEISDEILSRASRRIQLGNPPGKEGSAGDAINWEALLEGVPRREDLYFISADGDYASDLLEDDIGQFLDREWRTKKRSSIIFFKKISVFFREQFPHIQLASGVEQDLLIQELSQSGSFATTHAVTTKLSKFPDFTTSQVERLVSVAETNDQVGWIVGDDDLQALYARLLASYAKKLSKELRDRLDALIVKEEVEESSDPVF